MSSKSVRGDNRIRVLWWGGRVCGEDERRAIGGAKLNTFGEIFFPLFPFYLFIGFTPAHAVPGAAFRGSS